MASEAPSIDVSSLPDVSRLVREVVQTGEARVLRVDGIEATLSPTRRRKRKAKEPTQAEFEAAMKASFGSLKGLIDPDEFKRQRRELQVDEREPRTL